MGRMRLWLQLGDTEMLVCSVVDWREDDVAGGDGEEPLAILDEEPTRAR